MGGAAPHRSPSPSALKRRWSLLQYSGSHLPHEHASLWALPSAVALSTLAAAFMGRCRCCFPGLGDAAGLPMGPITVAI